MYTHVRLTYYDITIMQNVGILMLWFYRLQFRALQTISYPGLMLHAGNEGDCLHFPWSLPWCPGIDPVEIYNFPHRVPFIKAKMPWCPCPFKNKAYRRAYLEYCEVHQTHVNCRSCSIFGFWLIVWFTMVYDLLIVYVAWSSSRKTCRSMI